MGLIEKGKDAKIFASRFFGKDLEAVIKQGDITPEFIDDIAFQSGLLTGLSNS